MTDRIHSITVVLQKPIRDDDAEPLIQALKLFHGVADVIPNVASLESEIAVAKARKEIWDTLFKVLAGSPGGS